MSQETNQESENKIQYEAVVDLLCNIVSEKKKINDKIFIISSAYDKIYKKYNTFSLSLLILSSVSTAFEALRLSIVDLLDKLDVTDINSVSFVMNTIILTIGTVITVLSGIVRFRNYRELLEQLKDIQNQLILFRDKYQKKLHKVLNLLALDNLSADDVVTLREKFDEYDTAISNINISQYISNEDILKYNRFKAKFEIEMKKIVIDKIEAIQSYEKLKGFSSSSVYDLTKIDSIERFANLKKFKDFILKIDDESTITEVGFV